MCGSDGEMGCYVLGGDCISSHGALFLLPPLPREWLGSGSYRTFSGWCYGVVAQGSPGFPEGRALACEPSQEPSERL